MKLPYSWGLCDTRTLGEGGRGIFGTFLLGGLGNTSLIFMLIQSCQTRSYANFKAPLETNSVFFLLSR